MSSAPVLWWESVPKGRVTPLAFIKLDRKGSTQEWVDLDPKEVVRRRERYSAAVESIARTAQAAQPLNWQGDGVMLFLFEEVGDDGSRELLTTRAFRTAKLLWEQVRVALSLPVRIAVHAAEVPWNPDTGKLAHPAIDECGHLEHIAPENSIAITEDVYLLLPPDLQKDLAPLGITSRDRTPAYVYPGSAAARRQPEQFVPSPELHLWEAFRRYADSPEIRRLRYVGFRLTKKEPPSLDLLDVFVSPEFQPRVSKTMGLRSSLATGGRLPKGVREHVLAALESAWSRPEEVDGLPEELKSIFKDHQSLILLGDPGSGKTTLLRWLAVIAGKGRLLMARELGVPQRLLPLPVSIGTMAETRREMGKDASVVQALGRYFHARNVGVEPELVEFLRARLDEGTCLVLLDGLDEVAGEERESVRAWLETFAARYPRNRFVVTSRRVGYTPVALSDAAELVLRPFDDGQVGRYIKSFTRAYLQWETGTEEPLRANQAAQDLLDALRSNPRLRALARSPFLLSALALVHRAEGRLPLHRVQFYAMTARAICETWGTARRIVAGEAKREIPYEEEGLPIFGALALKMHDRWPAGVAPKEFILDTLSRWLQKKKRVSTEEAKKTAETFLRRAGDEVQVMLERGPGLWGFLHLTFQEFFAASGLLAEERFLEAILKEHRLFNPRWEEIVRLSVGYMALIQNRPLAAKQFIEAVLDYRPPKRLEWITAKLKKQVPFAVLLVGEAGDALARNLEDRVVKELVEWSARAPDSIRDRVFSQLSLTAFKERVAQACVARLSHRNPAVRLAAIRALGPLKADAAVAAILAALNDQHLEVRAAAARALGELKADAAVAALLAALNDQHPEVRVATARALGELKADAAVASLLAALNNKNESPEVRGRAAWALGWLKADAAVAPLLAALNDQHPEVRSAVARALGHRRVDAAVAPLVATLNDHVPRVRVSAANALGKLKADAAVAPLLAALNDQHPEVRAAAAQVLGELEANAALAPLLAALNNKNESPSVRGRAAWALGWLKADAALAPLLAALNDRHPEVRSAAAFALGHGKVDAAIAPLLTVLKDKDAWVRWAATRALTLLKADAALTPLLTALKDENSRTREAAANLLGELRANIAVPSLIATLQDRALSVRQAATQALWLISEKLSLSASAGGVVRSAKVSSTSRRRQNRRRRSRQ